MRRFGQLVAPAGLLFIAGTTLIPLPRQVAAAGATPLWCLVCGEYGGVDVVLNVLLFVPFALGLRLLGVPTPLVVAAGAAISFTVESLQLTVIPGRDASLSDLVTNTLGSLLGAILGLRLGVMLNPSHRQARNLVLAAGAIFLALQAGTALLLRPWVPTEPLKGAWARSLWGRTPFGGKVASVLMSGSAVDDGSIPKDPHFYARLLQSEAYVELRLVSGPTLPEWSPVFELLGRHGPVVAIFAVGSDLAFQPPARSYALRLRRPAIRLPAALPPGVGTRLQVEAGEQRNTLWGAWSRTGVWDRRVQALSPSFGWSLLIPFEYAYGSEVHLLTGLWIAALLLPVAYWAGCRQGIRPALSLGLLLVAGLGLIPMAMGYPAVHWSEWVAGIAGLGAGWASAAYFGGRCDSPFIKESC